MYTLNNLNIFLQDYAKAVRLDFILYLTVQNVHQDAGLREGSSIYNEEIIRWICLQGPRIDSLRLRQSCANVLTSNCIYSPYKFVNKSLIEGVLSEKQTNRN